MRFAISRTVLSLTAVFLALCARPAAAQQTATVQGTITDAASGAPIADARVTIAGTPLQSTTNVLGNYRITGINAGNVTLEIRRIGYKTLSAPLTLAAAQEFTGNYSLNASVVQLEEIVVTGTAGDQRSRAQAAPQIVGIVNARLSSVWTVGVVRADKRRIDVARRDQHAADVLPRVGRRRGAG